MKSNPERFWRCVPCEAVIRLTGDAPAAGAGDLDLMGPLWFAAAQQERGAFFEAHRTHLIELLTQTLPVVAATGPLWDPMTTLRWEVSNSSRRFVVEGSRDVGLPSGTRPTLDDPLRYRCRRGRLRAARVGVEVPAEEVSRIIDEALYPHVLPLRRLRDLTQAAVRAVATLAAEDVEILYDSPTDPMLGIGRIPAEALERMITNVGRSLCGWEVPLLATRLREARNTDELLLTVTRRYDVDIDS